MMDADKKDMPFSEIGIKKAFLKYIKKETDISNEEFLDFLFEIFLFYLYNASTLRSTSSLTRDIINYPNICMYDSTNNRIRYFPNLPISTDTADKVHTMLDTMVCMIKDTNTNTTTTLDNYMAYFSRKFFSENDLLSMYIKYIKEVEEGKWAPSSVKKTLYVYRISSPRRYFQKCGYDEIIVDKLCAAFAPTKCFITNDINTMIQAYEAGESSCMKSTSPSAISWRKTYNEKGFHPIQFYSYMPDIGMVYMLGGDTITEDNVLARAVVNTKRKLYYSAYYKDGPHHDTFTTWLKANGFKRDDNFLTKALPQKIRIKGIWSASNKDYIGPRPYVDGENFYYKTSFNIKTKTFLYVFTGLLGGGGKGFKKQKGFDAAKDFIAKPLCSSCNNKLGSRTYTYKKFVFCSTECVNILSLHIKSTADNVQEVSTTRGIVDPLSNEKFTSVYSARKRTTSMLGLSNVDHLPPVYIAETLKDIFNPPKSSTETYLWPRYTTTLYLCGGTPRVIQNSTLLRYIQRYVDDLNYINNGSSVYDICSPNIRKLIELSLAGIIYVDLDKIPRTPRIPKRISTVTW